MLDHVLLRVSDLEASERFYATVLPVLAPQRRPDFRLAAGGPVTRRLHIGFAAASRAEVDAFWRAGVDAGYRDDGAPGPRRQYSEDYYGGFLLDPDGNSAEAVHYGFVQPPGAVDHLWIRVADVAAARAFYLELAPAAGLRMGADTPERAQFRGRHGSFSLVPGEPTEHAHLAFPGERAQGPLTDPDGNTVEIVAAL